jgi:hypothetical protein
VLVRNHISFLAEMTTDAALECYDPVLSSALRAILIACFPTAAPSGKHPMGITEMSDNDCKTRLLPTLAGTQRLAMEATGSSLRGDDDPQSLGGMHFRNTQ